MKEEIKKLWLKALRSRKYPQGKQTLRTEEGFCCLGVACDVYQQVTGKGKWVKVDRSNKPNEKGSRWAFYGSDGLQHRDFLPYEVREWLGVDKHNPVIQLDEADADKFRKLIGKHNLSSEGKVTLSDLNDENIKFGTIANLIKKYL